ncbi:MAG: hypothetical protein AMXMBFR33_14880 [Candidatus Xenobia bacterium]
MKEHLELARALARVAREEGLAEIDYRNENARIHLIVDTGEAQPVAVPVQTPLAVAARRSPVRPATAAPEPANENLRPVVSPLAGVFYRSPNPGAPPFVQVGDHVSVGQTLCIIEAMKLMNEITAEMPGRVAGILVENAAVVESGQKIFLLEPLG